LPTYGSPDDPLSISVGAAGLIRDLRKAHEEVLAKGFEIATKTNPNVKVATEIRDGDPPTQIVVTAQDGNFDNIVVGHGGESRTRELFLGETSERIAHQSRCAVVIVK
jgi:nucleotide-binding universal stress UspA family protein